jgi:hypothetical protein
MGDHNLATKLSGGGFAIARLKIKDDGKLKERKQVTLT